VKLRLSWHDDGGPDERSWNCRASSFCCDRLLPRFQLSKGRSIALIVAAGALCVGFWLAVRSHSSPATQQKPAQQTVLLHLGDPQACPKPPEAYYSNSHVSGFEKYKLRSDLHNSRDFAIQTPFRGKVQVCFIVDTDGKVTNVRFAQSPGPDVEKYITEFISGWRYTPGNYFVHPDGKPIGTWQSVPVQESLEVIFSD
jgi:hypothetical protein